ncbi:MAG: tetratricopeptide repeat protein [Cyanobacteriota bacterium]
MLLHSQLIELVGNARAYFDRGIAPYRLEDYEGSVADCSRALTLNPQDTQTLLSHALLWDHRSNSYKAIEDYTQLLSLDLSAAERIQVLNSSAQQSRLHLCPGGQFASSNPRLHPRLHQGD